jgi:hypothetical protein
MEWEGVGVMDYSMYSKDSVTSFGLWTKLKVMLLGERHDSFSGHYHMIAYYYKNIWYITKYGRA